MDEVCRLCCSTNFVNNDIFDEENALYLKMSLYLPIKVFKNDRLPQRVCDKCSCKVNDLYQFCNETIATQHRLRAVLISNGVQLEETVDLTLIKHNTLSPAPLAPFVHKVEPTSEPCQNGTQHIPHYNNHERLFPPIPIADIPRINNCNSCDQATQTEDVYCSNIPVPNSSDMFKLSESNSSTLFSRMAQEPNSSEMYSKMVEASGNELFCRMAESMGQPPWALDVKVKQEPLFKQELDDYGDYGGGEGGGASDCSSEDITLSTIKKERKKRKKHSGERKKKPKLKELQELVGSALALVPGLASEGGLGAPPAVKTEPVEYHCCICFLQCYSRTEMLHHYKAHLSEALSSRGAPPAPPPPPATDPLKCMRCQKTLSRDEWDAHWLAHWERDARPLRCALCEKTFRDHAQVLRHGLTHKPDAALEPAHKRFACDVCGEAFVFMRCLLAHRLRAHPEAAARALAARCALCDRTFAHLNSLRRHLRAHTGERNFLCSVCGKALSSREHLKFHLRIHANYKPNVCKTCGKGFVKKCNLTLHERVHSGEKPHVCAHCGKAFSQRSTLVIHERYHSGARPYVCGLCGRGFVAKGLLSMHLKTTCI